MIRAALDIRYAGGHSSGVGRYVRNLARTLVQSDSGRFRYFFLGRPADFEALALPADSCERIPAPFSPENHPLSDLWINFRFPRELRKRNIRVFHAPSFMVPAVPLPAPLVTTVCDRVARALPGTVPPLFRTYLNFNVRTAVRRSARLIAISNFTRRELEREFSSLPPVEVVPLGTDPAPFSPNGTDPGIPGSYILVVGNIEPRKGILEMIRGFEAFRSMRPDRSDRLVFTGAPLWKYPEPYETRERSAFRESIHFTGYVDEERLASLYANAALNAVPSLYEGFGLPVLEAMRADAPILVNSCPALLETGKDAVCPVDIRTPHRVAEALSRLLDTKTPPERRRERYRKRLEAHTWVRCAEKTRGVYEELAS
jgi:glycosyltransferase involved in cell wall biosynthesis